MQPLPPNSSNPFSDAANPYASPSYQASGMMEPLVPFTRDQARLRLLGPAIGLGISACCWLLYMVFALVVTFIDGPLQKAPDNTPELIGMIIGMLIVVVGFCVPSLIMLIGSVQLVRVRGYYWCWAGVITAAIPCTFCFPISLPFGIWGMVVLYDARIKLAFYGGPSPFVVGR